MRLAQLALSLALSACGRPSDGERQSQTRASPERDAVASVDVDVDVRYVVFARDDLLWAVVPNGSPAIPLGLSASLVNFASRRTNFGFAASNH